ncbi:hypothetical protein AAC387_Pa11g1754 [Persea americana]
MMIPSATELQEAGVEFKRKKSASSFFDLTFEHGLMEMPRLWVSGYTNTRFRNFIAFEQCFPVFAIIVISVAFVPTFFTVFPYFRPAKP